MQRETLATRGKTTILFCLLMLGALVLLAACGNSAATSTGSGTTSNTANTSATSTSASSSSSTGSSYGNGKYGNGGSTTPTPTQAVTGPTKTVMITTDSSGSFTFSPTTLTITAGTTVIWKNTTSTAHTVTSDDQKTFNSGDSTPVSSGATFSFTFKTAGTFAYHCDYHPYMKATIIVK